MLRARLSSNRSRVIAVDRLRDHRELDRRRGKLTGRELACAVVHAAPISLVVHLVHASTFERRKPVHSGSASKQSAAMTRNAFPPIRSYNKPEARVSSAVANPMHIVP